MCVVLVQPPEASFCARSECIPHCGGTVKPDSRAIRLLNILVTGVCLGDGALVTYLGRPENSARCAYRTRWGRVGGGRGPDT